ncbi:Wzy polymerase domain-containing protein [Pseudomonas resinovorans]|uniref:PglL family O-oligosaccharyltransferase n=1 Tax=Metapseudomonas resinovorans TaxID=53412 RepID=UPI00237F4904|nr:O-antigen ligase family protein [Pseudomonas resinovorans]MDE3738385.1 Wzy polymerase domain-containing protein [Pseudomonas resinovorans]
MERVPIVPVLASGIMLVLSWVLPNHYYPWVAFYSDYLAFLALGTLGVCFVFHRRLSLSACSILLLLLALVPWGQWLAGQVVFLGDASISGLYLAGLAFAVILGRMAFTSWGRDSFEILSWVFLVGAILSCWVVLVQWLRLDGGIWVVDMRLEGRPYANLAQPNNLATLLLMAVASLLYLREKRRLQWWSASMIALTLIFCLVLTQSRTPWLGVLCLFGWHFYCYRSFGLRLSPIRLLPWIAVYALFVLALPVIADAMHLTAYSVADRAQALHRLALWKQMLVAVYHGGWWGYGWNQVSTAQVAVSLIEPVSMMTEHAHNIVLDMLIWNGPLLGLAAVALISFHFLRLASRSDSPEGFYAWLVIGLVFLHGMLELPLEYAYFLIPVGFLIGLIEAEQGVPELASLPRFLGGGVWMVGVLVLGLVWVEYRKLEDDYRLMRFETARIGDHRAGQSAPDVWLLSNLREFVRFARTEARPDMPAGELEWMRRVAHRYPYPPSLFRYSLALGLNGHPQAARLEMMRLQALHGDEMYAEAQRGLVILSKRYPQLAGMLSADSTD